MSEGNITVPLFGEEEENFEIQWTMNDGNSSRGNEERYRGLLRS